MILIAYHSNISTEKCVDNPAAHMLKLGCYKKQFFCFESLKKLVSYLVDKIRMEEAYLDYHPYHENSSFFEILFRKMASESPYCSFVSTFAP